MIVEKDLKRQKKGKKTNLMHQTLTKITPEDIFLWIREGFKQTKEKQDLIAKTFTQCGYFGEKDEEIEETGVMNEISNNFSNMMIIESENELAENIPLEDENESEEEDKNKDEGDNKENFKDLQGDEDRMEIE